MLISYVCIIYIVSLFLSAARPLRARQLCSWLVLRVCNCGTHKIACSDVLSSTLDASSRYKMELYMEIYWKLSVNQSKIAVCIVTLLASIVSNVKIHFFHSKMQSRLHSNGECQPHQHSYSVYTCVYLSLVSFLYISRYNWKYITKGHDYYYHHWIVWNSDWNHHFEQSGRDWITL